MITPQLTVLMVSTTPGKKGIYVECHSVDISVSAIIEISPYYLLLITRFFTFKIYCLLQGYIDYAFGMHSQYDIWHSVDSITC